MAISPQRLTIYLYSAHRAVIFAIAQLSCYYYQQYSSIIAIQQNSLITVKKHVTYWFNVGVQEVFLEVLFKRNVFVILLLRAVSINIEAFDGVGFRHSCYLTVTRTTDLVFVLSRFNYIAYSL